MSLAHFLTEYATHPYLGPYYDHWLHEGNFGTFGHIWQPDWSGFGSERTPSLDWFEQDTSYTLQLEIPGVRREDMTMHVSDDGRSLTIEGKTEKLGGYLGLGGGDERPKTTTSGRIKRVRRTMADGTIVVISRTEKKHSVGTTVKFTRTVSLPSYVDGKRIAAKLENGILTVTIPKLNTPKPRRIVID
ncbi:hypothetical protein RSOLAG22IIIB_00839 [Rhizoctonia solani]|uniref:SHSP domain-containing protein n=1 Tax=Rhizoctonia solani TaxID=456999 RepID=A0A0K6G0W2_9AGAM|nr:unnamed protein product [Rhizoctonia solani]CUA72176.1 hypothetical protein RSOLAG22IIIB_00839 [Rhizoctonia solani]